MMLYDNSLMLKNNFIDLLNSQVVLVLSGVTSAASQKRSWEIQQTVGIKPTAALVNFIYFWDLRHLFKADRLCLNKSLVKLFTFKPVLFPASSICFLCQDGRNQIRRKINTTTCDHSASSTIKSIQVSHLSSPPSPLSLRSLTQWKSWSLLGTNSSYSHFLSLNICATRKLRCSEIGPLGETHSKNNNVSFLWKK